MRALVLCLFVFSAACSGMATEQQIGQPRPLQEMDATIEPAVKVSWQSEVGKVYSIEASFDLEQWEDVAVTQSQGLTTSWYEAITQYPKKFYRIRQKESLGKLLVVPGGVSDLYIVYSDGTRGRGIKDTLGAVWRLQLSPDGHKILYSELATPGGEVCDLKLYDVASDSTTTLVTGVASAAYFDPKDSSYCLYCDSEGNIRRARIDSFPGQTLIDSSYDIRSFLLSPDGSVIVTDEQRDEHPQDRMAAYEASGGLIRVLWQGDYSYWDFLHNFSMDKAGQQVFCSYISQPQYQHTVKIINVRTGVASELPALLPVWAGMAWAWAPYDNLLLVETGDFYSPVDGSLTTDNTLQLGLHWRGVDTEGYLYRVSPDLTQVRRIEE